MQFPHGETVTRLRATATTTDPYSQESTPDWSEPPSELAIENCAVADGGSVEPREADRNSVQSDFDVIDTSGTEVRATDRLIIRGLTCQVVGRPFDWRSPFTGWAPGKVIRAKIVEG